IPWRTSLPTTSLARAGSGKDRQTSTAAMRTGRRRCTLVSSLSGRQRSYTKRSLSKKALRDPPGAELGGAPRGVRDPVRPVAPRSAASAHLRSGLLLGAHRAGGDAARAGRRGAIDPLDGPLRERLEDEEGEEGCDEVARDHGIEHRDPGSGARGRERRHRTGEDRGQP